MKIEPVLTEKSLEDAKMGRYTFWVPKNLTKPQIAILINNTFGVNVTKVRTLTTTKETKKNMWGRKRTINAKKKAMVNLSEKEKIDLFETKD